jgi:protein involved in polysaccharide export with SLBB domain
MMKLVTCNSMAILFCFFMVSCSTTQNPNYKRMNDSNIETKKVSSQQNVLKSNEDIPSFEDRIDLVSPGFLFSLYHPSDEKLSGNFRVNFDGYLYLPYNVKIDTSNLSINELHNKVLETYKTFFQRGVSNVRFTLLNKEYYVEVRGMVGKSGRYLVKRDESLDKVIDLAGGIKGNISKDIFTASIKQQEMSYTINLNQFFESNFYGKSPTWTGADTVFVSTVDDSSSEDSIPIVTVLGGVMQPGKVLYNQNANLFYYLRKSGGVISNLDFNESYLLRQTEKGTVKIKFNLTEMDTIPEIYPNDIVMLNAEKKTLLDKFLERTVQVASILTSIILLKIAF